MTTINLSKLKAPVINLEKERTVSITGSWKGARLIIKGASNTRIKFDAVIESTHPEDAICFEGDVSNLELIGFDNRIIGGGVTFWGRLEEVSITSLNIFHPHTGIRATQPLPHSKVLIKSCYIVGASHEGIYIGPSFATTQPGTSVRITDNRIVASGWDGIQVGNTNGVQVYDNALLHTAAKKDYGQDYAITINPGCTAWVWGNVISDTRKKLQVLDSRCFDHEPQ